MIKFNIFNIYIYIIYLINWFYRNRSGKFKGNRKWNKRVFGWVCSVCIELLRLMFRLYELCDIKVNCGIDYIEVMMICNIVFVMNVYDYD